MGVFKFLMDVDDRVDLENVVSEDLRPGNQWMLCGYRGREGGGYQMAGNLSYKYSSQYCGTVFEELSIHCSTNRLQRLVVNYGNALIHLARISVRAHSTTPNALAAIETPWYLKLSNLNFYWWPFVRGSK